jgi:hypothetical protein
MLYIFSFKELTIDVDPECQINMDPAGSRSETYLDIFVAIENNYLLTYDSYVPLYNRFHRGEWITRITRLRSCHLRAQECPGPPPPPSPK